MKNRGNQLRIFDTSHKKAPTLAEVTLQLTEIQDHSSNNVNVVNWIVMGLEHKMISKFSVSFVVVQV